MASVVLTASPAVADQAPTYTFHTQSLWKQIVTQDPNTGERQETCFRLPAVVKTKRNVLLAFAERRNKSCADHGVFDVVMRRSLNNGVDWETSRPVVPSKPGEVLQGNATVVADLADLPDDSQEGKVFLFTTSEPAADRTTPRKPAVRVSADDGKTWSAPTDLSNVIKAPAGAADWFATGPGHGIQKAREPHKGRLVVPVYFAVGDRQSVRLIYSDDHGGNWRIGATATYSKSVLKLSEPTLVEQTDGGILVIARNGALDEPTSVQGMARGVSRDGGDTFHGDFRVDTSITAPPTHPSTLRQRWGTSSYSRILLSAPATPKTNNNPRGMNVRSSFDEGTTWRDYNGTLNPKGVRIDDDFAAYSDMVLIGNGAIGVLYEAGENRFRDEIRWNWFWESALGLP
ncbi:sialidase family protein [Nonomuraea sp. SYSU D8015]|uniref:sialidase family protein n=1 Tax=Nonomuraea sp. SYSU D8015 TaxID=2593644 RepID=UPI001660F579|nr:sialidase family protein [Nonomuraea sp. SYSU D8015]